MCLSMICQLQWRPDRCLMAVGKCRVAGAGGAQSAKTAAGDDVKASVWLQSHKKGEQLPQGSFSCCRDSGCQC